MTLTFVDWESHDPPEGHRVELVHGRFRTHSPHEPTHQRVMGRLRGLLDDAGVYVESAVASSGNPAELVVTGDITVKVDVDTLFAPRRQPGTV
jgi:hypothetical protein